LRASIRRRRAFSSMALGLLYMVFSLALFRNEV